MTLPIMQSDSKELSMMQTRWASEINPLLKNPSLQSIILPEIQLVTGSNAINHRLGRKLQGWRIVRNRAFYVVNVLTNYNIYDTQDDNNDPELTLLLLCDQGTDANPVKIDLEVF